MSNKKDKPLVSIITPCYNGEKFVHRFLDSILTQTYPNLELIFINDGSKDKTEEIVLSYQRKFDLKGIEFKYVYQENKGQAAALNQGLKIFKGEYLTWPDSDDILHENNISEKVEFLEKNINYGFVLCKSHILDEESLEVVGELKRKVNQNIKDDLFRDLIIERNVFFAPGGYMIRVACLDEVIPSRKIYENRGGQNWQLLLPMAYNFKYGYIDKYLYNYLVRVNSHSREARDYETEINRCDLQEDIIKNTIAVIEQMPEDEKEYWINYVRIKYIQKKFMIASSYRKKDSLDNLYSEIKINKINNFKNKIIYYSGKHITVYYMRLILIFPIRLFRKVKRRLNDR